MKPFFYLLTLSVVLSSCSVNGTKYIYSYELQNSTGNKNEYEDNSIFATFDVQTKMINFKIENLTDKALTVIWDESSFVIFNEANKAAHGETKYINAEQTQVPTIIPPKAFLNDALLPIKNIGFSSGSKYSAGGWTLDYFLPVWDMDLKKNVDKILSAKGKTVGIFLPIEIDGIKHDYYFKFLITDVKKDKYPYRPQTVID